jgi:anti-sigma28 factor (negative regulator of flagellin synthesis)
MSIRLQPDVAITNGAVGRTGETDQAGSVGAATSSGRFSTRSTSTDNVQISGPSSALNQLATERAARIDQLTAIVQGGSYDVSSAKVGRAVVSDAVSGGG